MALTLGLSLSSCGDSFLESEYFKGIDQSSELNEGNIVSLTNGIYNNLYSYYFAGNYAVTIGDIPTDLSYWNTKTNHWNDLYMFTYLETDGYLNSIWTYGYKVVDQSSRVIQQAKTQLEKGEGDPTTLNQCLAEAYACRAYANLMMVNIFAHQVKVNGTSFEDRLGLVISETPIPAGQQVARATIGETYDFIMKDCQQSIQCFEAAGGGNTDPCYFTLASVNGLAARASLYREDWTNAKQYAEKAIELSGIKELAKTPEAYAALYSDTQKNTESLFYLDITATDGWSANSAGNVWSTYNFSPSPKLLAMYEQGDARKAIQAWAKENTETVPVYAGGKYGLASPAANQLPD